MALPSQFSSQEADLRRKQMLAQLLMQQGMQQPQGQMVGQHYVAPSLLSTLAPVASAFAGGKLGQDAEAGNVELQSAYRKALGEQLAAYREKTAADPMAAQEFMTSEFDPVKQIATKDYERLQKAMAPRTVNDKVISLQPGKGAEVLYDGAPKFKDEVLFTREDGIPVHGQRDADTGRGYAYGGQGKGIEINTGNDAWDKRFVEQVTKRLDKSYETTSSRVNAVRSLDAAMEDLDKGIRSGMGAEVELGMAKAYSWLSGTPLGEVDVNTEVFKNNMKRQVASIAKSIFTGVMTDTDRKFLEDMSGADPMLDAESISRLLKYTKADAYNNVLEHQNLLDRTKANPKLGADVDADFWKLELPPISETPDKDGIYFDKELKRFRVKPPEVKEKTEVNPQDFYQSIKPIGTNSQGMPQYRLEEE